MQWKKADSKLNICGVDVIVPAMWNATVQKPL